MFIASTDLGGGETLLVLGLSQANRDRMAQGQPIRLSRETHGVAIPAGLKVIIFAGDTEESMKEELGTLIGPTTVVDQKRAM